MKFFDQIKSALGTLIQKDLTNSSEAEIAQALEDAASKEVVAPVEDSSSVEMSTEMRTILDAQNSVIIAQSNQIVELSKQVTTLTESLASATEDFTKEVKDVKDSTLLAISGVKEMVAKNSVLKGDVADTTNKPAKDPVVAAVDKAEKDEEEEVVELNTLDFLKFRNSLRG